MPLIDLVAPNAIIPALKVNGKKQALQELAARPPNSPGRTNAPWSKICVQREKLGSTGGRQRHCYSARQAAEAGQAVRTVRAARPAGRLRCARRPAGRPDLPSARAGRRRRRSPQGAGAGGAASARCRGRPQAARLPRRAKHSTRCLRCRPRARRSSEYYSRC